MLFKIKDINQFHRRRQNVKNSEYDSEWFMGAKTSNFWTRIGYEPLLCSTADMRSL
jgi:hypothetical protein